MRHNLTQNGVDDVIILNCAICDITGCVPFYRAPSEKFGMGSLDAQFHGETTEVQARTLDDVLEETRIRHVDLLKVDVEGFELTVFRGAWKLLTGTCPPLILFEFCDWAEARVPSAQAGDAQRFLLDRGYSICRLSDFLRDRRPLHEPLKTGSAMLAAWHGKSNVQ
ncbi:MAG: hypothetical protein AUI36_30195 [Cyanobacteria bacterium 13_1_40CM_2_61_4]|nr:MAG: hypothetical protein AUI36_30195 [Cyanobacteria bacterium 13_1_40CM_2_61_4]